MDDAEEIKQSLLGLMPSKPVTTLGEAQSVWSALAKATAKGCLDSEGKVDVIKVDEVIRFWEATNKEHSREFNAVQHLPSWRLVRDQTLAVLGALVPQEKDTDTPTDANSSTELAVALESAPARAYCSHVGSEILKIMGCDNPREAILASLLTPHRQMYLPTCSLNALIISETFNHPERLAKAYCDLLTAPPRTCIQVNGRMALQSQPIVKCPVESVHKFVWVEPNQSPITLNSFFDADPEEQEVPDSDGGSSGEPSAPPLNPKQRQKRCAEMLNAQDIYVEQPTDGKGYGLYYPIRDLTDLFFADLMQNIYGECDASQAYIKVRELYFGVAGDQFVEGGTLEADQPIDKNKDYEGVPGENEAAGDVKSPEGKPLNGQNSHTVKSVKNKKYYWQGERDDFLFTAREVSQLKDQFSRLISLRPGARLATIFTQQNKGTIDQPEWDKGHVENIDIYSIANFKSEDESCIISDRNYVNANGENTYLALLKISDENTTADGECVGLWKFVEVVGGYIMEKVNVKWIAFEAESDKECLTSPEETTI